MDFLIKPPTQEQLRSKIRERILLVDSRSRDRTRYPDPNDYVIDLKENLKNVTSMELVHCYVPFNPQLIHSNNNTFWLDVYDADALLTTYEIVIPEGNYSKTELAAKMTELITIATSKDDFSGFSMEVDYNANTSKYYFIIKGPYNVRVYANKRNDNAFGNLFGLDNTIYSSEQPLIASSSGNTLTVSTGDASIVNPNDDITIYNKETGGFVPSTETTTYLTQKRTLHATSNMTSSEIADALSASGLFGTNAAEVTMFQENYTTTAPSFATLYNGATHVVGSCLELTVKTPTNLKRYENNAGYASSYVSYYAPLAKESVLRFRLKISSQADTFFHIGTSLKSTTHIQQLVASQHLDGNNDGSVISSLQLLSDGYTFYYSSSNNSLVVATPCLLDVEARYNRFSKTKINSNINTSLLQDILNYQMDARVDTPITETFGYTNVNSLDTYCDYELYVINGGVRLYDVTNDTDIYNNIDSVVYKGVTLHGFIGFGTVVPINNITNPTKHSCIQNIALSYINSTTNRSFEQFNPSYGTSILFNNFASCSSNLYSEPNSWTPSKLTRSLKGFDHSKPSHIVVHASGKLLSHTYQSANGFVHPKWMIDVHSKDVNWGCIQTLEVPSTDVFNNSFTLWDNNSNVYHLSRLTNSSNHIVYAYKYTSNAAGITFGLFNSNVLSYNNIVHATSDGSTIRLLTNQTNHNNPLVNFNINANLSLVYASTFTIASSSDILSAEVKQDGSNVVFSTSNMIQLSKLSGNAYTPYVVATNTNVMKQVTCTQNGAKVIGLDIYDNMYLYTLANNTYISAGVLNNTDIPNITMDYYPRSSSISLSSTGDVVYFSKCGKHDTAIQKMSVTNNLSPIKTMHPYSVDHATYDTTADFGLTINELSSNEVFVSQNTTQGNPYDNVVLLDNRGIYHNVYNRIGNVITMSTKTPTTNSSRIVINNTTLYTPYIANFSVDDTAVVHINDYGLVESNYDKADNSFIILPRNNDYAYRYNPSKMVKFFEQPLQRVQKLHVRLQDMYGNPYQQKNQDHYFQFRIIETDGDGKIKHTLY
jgi:hypothetical protein